VTTSPSNEFDEYRDRRTRLASLESAADTLISFDSSDATTSLSNEFNEAADRRAQLATVEAAGHTLSGGSTIPGPASLYVCQESRVLTLQGYRPVFGRLQLDAPFKFCCNACYEPGDNSAWDKALVREPKIWVDFERDVIVVESLETKEVHYPNFRFPERAPFGPLSLIRIFAKEESKNIRRLGVAARQLT
jgi:hypothetical protein